MSNRDDINPWDTTPDLSGFSGANPKKFKAKKKPKGMNRIGKRTEAWLEGQPKLKEIFKENGTTICEIETKKCVKNSFLGFAHTRRRNTFSEEELVDPRHNVLACQPCHYHVDFEMKKADAEKLLDSIVEARGW
jgi:hypothetical protein